MMYLKKFMSDSFIKCPLFTLSLIALLIFANFLAFTTVRSIILNIQGLKEVSLWNKKDNYLFNLDPKYNFESVDNNLDLNLLFKHLNDNFTYAIEVNGIKSGIRDSKNMEINLEYISKEAYRLNKIDLIKGKHLNYDNNYTKDPIPVLIGASLEKLFPLDTIFKLKDPTLEKEVTLQVKGVIQGNSYKSLKLAPNTKEYRNFSIVIPINQNFIYDSNELLKVNSIHNLLILDSNDKSVEGLKRYFEKYNIYLNFYGKNDNDAYFKENFYQSYILISCITTIILVVIIGLALWNTFKYIHLTTKEIILNILVGLSYERLKFVYYSYYIFLSSISSVILFILIAYNRWLHWVNKESNLATYNIWGLLDIDWYALLVVIGINLFVSIIIVELSILKVKRIPLSKGLLL